MRFKPSYSSLDEFKFQSGRILEDLKVEYTTIGAPERGFDDLIENGVLHIHGWSGDYSSVERLTPLTREGGPLEKFFIISPTSLGSPRSASPSSTNLGPKFPRYTIADMVNFHYKFIEDEFGIEKLKGVIGASMGGFQALQWGVSYPDFMDFLILLVTSYKTSGINYAIFNYVNTLIKTDPNYRGGFYDENPWRSTSLASMFMYLYGFSREYYHSLENRSLEDSMKREGREGAKLDANDIIWRNNAAMNFNLKEQLDRIKADTLIVGINGDQYFPPHLDATPLSEKIKNSKLVIYDSINGHFGVNELEKIKKELKGFLDPY